MPLRTNTQMLNKLKRSEHLEKSLSIFQLNCNSLNNKLSEIKIYLYTKKPDIMGLCETMVKKKEPKFVGYTPIWKHRLGEKGGLALLIRNDINFKVIDFEPFHEGGLELQIIELASNLGKIRLANVYNPHKNITVTEFRYYLFRYPRYSQHYDR